MVEKPTIDEFTDTLYREYRLRIVKSGVPVAKIFPVADAVCKEYAWDYRQFGEALSMALTYALQGRISYRISIHPDMTPREMAAWQRRKRENRIFVDDYPVALIEMKKVK